MSVFIAGGTDVTDRRRHGLLDAAFAELPSVASKIEAKGGLAIGAMTPIADLAQIEGYVGLAEAAAHLATPQIRRQGTVGGNLLQSSRCRYYRHPHLPCTHKGDPDCGGRTGEDDNAVVFDPGESGCAHPHPSTLAMALMAYDAEIEVDGERCPIAALYEAGDRTATHTLTSGKVLNAIHVPPVGKEHARYVRVSARALAEWAIVEACVRYQVKGGKITGAQVAVGAVAPVPLRLPQVEAALIGCKPDEAVFAQAAALATQRANPLPQSRYKLAILVAAVKRALTEA